MFHLQGIIFSHCSSCNRTGILRSGKREQGEFRPDKLTGREGDTSATSSSAGSDTAGRESGLPLNCRDLQPMALKAQMLQMHLRLTTMASESIRTRVSFVPWHCPQSSRGGEAREACNKGARANRLAEIPQWVQKEEQGKTELPWSPGLSRVCN